MYSIVFLRHNQILTLKTLSYANHSKTDYLTVLPCFVVYFVVYFICIERYREAYEVRKVKK